MRPLSLESILFEQPQNGYAPREDSWLLTRAMEENEPIIVGKKCLDMGCGSGIQTAALLNAGANSVTCADINPSALKTTQKMVEEYFPKANVNYSHSNLFQNIPKKETFDIMVFNPPYVPSEKIKWAEVDGGEKGREIIDVFLDSLPEHLNKKGVCFLLQSSLNGIQTTKNKLKKIGMKGTIIAREKVAFEELLVWKITRS